MSNPQENLPLNSSSPSVQDIIKKGAEIYDTLKGELEAVSGGEYIVIEVDTKEHFIGDTRDEAILKAKIKFPDKVMFVRKIGQIEKISRHFSYSQQKYARLF